MYWLVNSEFGEAVCIEKDIDLKPLLVAVNNINGWKLEKKYLTLVNADANDIIRDFIFNMQRYSWDGEHIIGLGPVICSLAHCKEEPSCSCGRYCSTHSARGICSSCNLDMCRICTSDKMVPGREITEAELKVIGTICKRCVFRYHNV